VSRALIGCILVVVIFSIAPLAHSRPPDPTWIAGVDDDADYDGVVGLVTSGEGCVRSRVRVIIETSGDACVPSWLRAATGALALVGRVTLDPGRSLARIATSGLVRGPPATGAFS